MPPGASGAFNPAFVAMNGLDVALVGDTSGISKSSVFGEVVCFQDALLLLVLNRFNVWGTLFDRPCEPANCDRPSTLFRQSSGSKSESKRVWKDAVGSSNGDFFRSAVATGCCGPALLYVSCPGSYGVEKRELFRRSQAGRPAEPTLFAPVLLGLTVPE